MRCIIFSFECFIVLKLSRARVVFVIQRSDAMLRQLLSVDEDAITANLYMISRKTYDALNVVGFVRKIIGPQVAFPVVWIARIFEDYYVAALYLALRQERERLAGREDELIDKQVIANGDRVLH